jgi:hypothetical protein
MGAAAAETVSESPSKRGQTCPNLGKLSERPNYFLK